MKWYGLLLIFVSLASCSDTKQREVGQFVYVDCFNTIHVDRNCASTLADNPKTKEERMANMQGVQFIDTCKIVRNTSWQQKFCPKCVDDESYKRINAMMDRNEVKPPAY